MFKQIELKYAYDALEPSIDAKTMEVHYSKHHATYTKNFNDLVKDNAPEWLDKPAEELFKNLDKLSEAARTAIRNNGGGYYNHNLYFEALSPNGGGEPKGALAEAINKTFGSFDKLKEELTKAAIGRFGSGWAWLALKEGELKVCSSANQDNPYMKVCSCEGKTGVPLLALDVWEHAYYLNYQNRRPDYIAAFFNVVDWNVVADRYNKAI